jgi:uncharacterized membrane protein YfcA
VLAVAAIVVAVAGIVRGFSGFGSAMIMAPALSLLFGPSAAIATMTLMEVPTLVQLLPDAWRHGDRRSVVTLGLAAMTMVPVGAWLLVHLDELVMRRAIGLLVLGFAAVLGLGWRYRGTLPLPVTLGVGASSGLLSGAMGTPGPPIIFFYLSGPANPTVARGSMIGFFAFTTTTALITYGSYGLYTEDVLWRAAGLLPAFASGIWLGRRLFGKVSEVAFRRATLALLALIGTATVFS